MTCFLPDVFAQQPSLSLGTGSSTTSLTQYMPVVVTGTNYCVGCALKTDADAKANCKVYGHKHALKVDQLMDETMIIFPEFTGLTLFYLENEKSTKLINDNHGKRITVHGKLYLDTRVLEVESFEYEGDPPGITK